MSVTDDNDVWLQELINESVFVQLNGSAWYVSSKYYKF